MTRGASPSAEALARVRGRRPPETTQDDQRRSGVINVSDRLIMTDTIDRIEAALADRYTIECELGAGILTTAEAAARFPKCWVRILAR